MVRCHCNRNEKLFSIIILMAQVRKDKLNDYWFTDPILDTPIFRKLMSHNRCEQIWWCVHFNINKLLQLSTNRLFEIQHLLDFFLERFQTIHKPNQQLSLGEAMIPWRGMATAVWCIQYRQLYGNCCLVYTAQTAVWQLLFGVYSTDSCMATAVWCIHHGELYGKCCLVYTAKTAVWQLLFGVYSTHSCMETAVWCIQHREMYGNFCLVCTAQRAVWRLVFVYEAQTAV